MYYSVQIPGWSLNYHFQNQETGLLLDDLEQVVSSWNKETLMVTATINAQTYGMKIYN